MRGLAAFGFLLVTLTQVYFLATGLDRPSPYLPIQTATVLASLVLVWGGWTAHPAFLAAGFGVNGFMRLLQPLLGLSRLPIWLNALLVASWAWATFASATRRSVELPLWALGAVHAIGVLVALGRAPAALALAVAAAGFMLAAIGQHGSRDQAPSATEG